MRAQKYLAPLAELLANHADDAKQAVRIAQTAGINKPKIVEGSAESTWFSIVELADSQGHASISELVHQAFKTIPNSEKQAKAKQLVDDYCRFLDQPLVCPYPGGLRSFGVYDDVDYTRFFRGRTDEIETIYKELGHYGYVVIYGRSGGGKSSLLQAGVIATIGDQYTLFGGKPIRPSQITNTKELLNSLQLVEQQGTLNKPILIAFDQFEEIYGSQVSIETKLDVINWLRNTIKDARHHKNIAILVCIRSDFIDELIEDGLWPVLSQARVCVLPLRATALKSAIAEPASDLGIIVDADVLETIANEAEDQQGALPFVQETMRGLWQQVVIRNKKSNISSEDYFLFTKNTGLGSVISRYADEVFNENLSTKEKLIIMRVFLRMIEFTSGRKNVRRQQTFDELMSDDHIRPELDQTLDKLTGKRLITRDLLTNETILAGEAINIAHEILIAEWSQLKKWIDKYRGDELDRRSWEERAYRFQNKKIGGDLLSSEQLIDYEGWQQKGEAKDLGISQNLRLFYDHSKQVDDAKKRKELELVTRKEKAEIAKRRIERIILISLSIISILLFSIYVVIPEIWRQQAMGTSVVIPTTEITKKDSSKVTIEKFSLHQTEVSNRQYRLCFEQGLCKNQEPIGEEGRIQFGNSEYSNHPVVDITYLQAANFCTWLGMSLPTPYQLLAAYESPNTKISHITPLTYFSEITSTITLKINNQPIYNLVGNASEMTLISASTLDKKFFNLLGGSFLSPRNKITIDDIEGENPDGMNKNTSGKEIGFRCVMN